MSELLDRLVFDFSNMYAIGLELVTLSPELLLRRQRVTAPVTDRVGFEGYRAKITETSKNIQKCLTAANLARTDTIRRTIDPHVLD